MCPNLTHICPNMTQSDSLSDHNLTQSDTHVTPICPLQALPDAAESLCIAEMGGTEERDGEPGLAGQLYLNIGLQNGVLLRTVLDQVRKAVRVARF